MAKFYRTLRAPLERGAIHMAMAIIPRLPRKGVLLLAEVGGRAGYHCDRMSRKIGLANLDLAFGDSKTLAEKNRILKTSSITMARTLMDNFWFAHSPEDRLNQYITLDPSIEAYFEDKPAICITAHFGNWEIFGQMSGLKNCPLSSIATPVKNETVNKYLIRAREATGQKIIPRAGALRKLLGILRKNGKTAFLADQNTKESDGALWVDFFGVPVRVTGAPALLAARTGTEILVGFGMPQAGGHYKIYVTERIIPPADTSAEAIQKLTQEITLAAEEEIRKHPEYWLWSYKRWRKIYRPEDSGRYPFYAKHRNPTDGSPIQ